MVTIETLSSNSNFKLIFFLLKKKKVNLPIYRPIVYMISQLLIVGVDKIKSAQSQKLNTQYQFSMVQTQPRDVIHWESPVYPWYISLRLQIQNKKYLKVNYKVDSYSLQHISIQSLTFLIRCNLVLAIIPQMRKADVSNGIIKNDFPCHIKC